MNMYNWIDRLIFGEKKPLPILSFPAVQYLYITVKELVSSSAYQAMGMRMLADHYDMPAALTYMDLSVEAEAFGAHCVYGVDEVPTIIGKLIATKEDAEKLRIPEVGEGRTGVALETVRKAQMLISDRPVIANCIGPFSLAGRLMNVNDIMVACYTDEETVHIVLEKATEFIIKYLLALKEAGANGAVLAEPLAGLLSPELMREFSTNYVNRIVRAVQDKHFILIYHNCGGSVNKLIPEMIDTGCIAFHFGESADMKLMLEKFPRNYLILGNISPSKSFNHSTIHDLEHATTRLLNQCGSYNNFIISSGCDIPPYTDMDNIDAFFDNVQSYYYRQRLWDMIM